MPRSVSQDVETPTPANLLIVEGRDDVFTLKALAEKAKIADRFAIREEEGFQNLRVSVPAYLVQTNLQRIGFVVDADTDIAARWQSMRDRFQQSGYTNLPRTPTTEGVILAGKIRVGLWIMPNNQLPGALEDFAKFLIPQGDPLLSVAEAYVETAKFVVSCNTGDGWMAKAKIHAWLACQKEPGKPMGHAITGGFLRHEMPEAQNFVSWLRRLFELEAVL